MIIDPSPTNFNPDRMPKTIAAREFKGEVGGTVRRVTQEPPKEIKKPGHFLHRLCNKEHKRGECSQQCKFCKMKGNHLEDNCWTKYPEKRPKPYTPNKNKKDKGRGRSRSRDKSVEKEERKKRAVPRAGGPHTLFISGRKRRRI